MSFNLTSATTATSAATWPFRLTPEQADATVRAFDAGLIGTGRWAMNYWACEGRW